MLHTDSDVCVCVCVCVCVHLHTILSASVFIIRLRRHCGGGIWVLCGCLCSRMCVVYSVCVCVWLAVGAGGSITVGDRQMGMEMSRQWAHANLLLQLLQLIQAQNTHARTHTHKYTHARTHTHDYKSYTLPAPCTITHQMRQRMPLLFKCSHESHMHVLQGKSRIFQRNLKHIWVHLSSRKHSVHYITEPVDVKLLGVCVCVWD